MRKTLVALAAAVAGLVVAFAPTAANAYPDPVLTNLGGSAADGVVAPGETFTLTGAFDGVDCSPWSAVFNGTPTTPAGGSGTTFSISATAPTTPGTYSLVFTCTYDDGQPTASTAPAAFTPGAATQILPLPFAIQVQSATGGAGTGTGTGTNAGNGVLPKTGGPSVALLAAGGALVLAGGAVVAVRRRQAA